MRPIDEPTEITELFEGVSRSVPDLTDYPTLREIRAASRRLTQEYVGTITVETVGSSAEGRPVELLRIGDGPISLLLLGAVHPAEPIGVLTLDLLIAALCVNGNLRKRFRHCTFLFIKVADPDGVIHNPNFDYSHSRFFHGGSTLEYANKFRFGSHLFIFEVPFWKTRHQDDESQSDLTIEEVKYTGLELKEEIIRQFADQYKALRAEAVKRDDPQIMRLVTATDERLQMVSLATFQRHLKQLREQSGHSRNATLSEVWKHTGSSVYYIALRPAGAVWRLAAILGEHDRAAQLLELLETNTRYVNDQAEIIPVQTLVQLQLGAGLFAINEAVNEIRFPQSE